MGYKMKKFSGFKSSPAKVSSQSLVDAQAKLDKTELDFRQPGWAKAAKEAHEGFKRTIGLKKKGKKKDGTPEGDNASENTAGTDSSGTLKSVGEIMKNVGELKGGGTTGATTTTTGL